MLATPTDSDMRRNIALMLAAAALVGLHIGLFESVFNNYLSEVHQLGSSQRGILEFPRELPGFLVAIFAGLLFLLSDTRAAAVAMLTLSAGLIGLGYFADSFGAMIGWMMLWSVGHHLFMPLEQSIAVSLSKDGQVGRRLGQIGAATTAATIVGAGVVWVGVDYLSISFTQFFTMAAIAGLLAGVVLWKMKVSLPSDTPEHVETQRPSFKERFFFRREYGVYYLMSILFGARKQVFLTFGPWVLVKILGEPASTIAKLWMVSAILGIVFRPLLGRLIDRIGERPILVVDAALLALICIGYGVGPNLAWGSWGIRLAYTCFVLDQMLFAVGMARVSYLKRIAVDPKDLTPTLSLGVSIDHAVSMSLPALGGLIWLHYGYPAVFWLAAGISIVNMVVCSQARVPTASVDTPALAQRT